MNTVWFLALFLVVFAVDSHFGITNSLLRVLAKPRHGLTRENDRPTVPCPRCGQSPVDGMFIHCNTIINTPEYGVTIRDEN